MDDPGVGGGAGLAVLSRPELERAWLDTLAADAADAHISAAVQRFAEDVDDRLDGLFEELANGSWRPRTLMAVQIPKENGTRELHVPSVRDRIIERAVLRRIGPLIDPDLGPSSYAYRPGLGVADAVTAVCALRDEGLNWVVRADIDDCFPTVDRDLVRRELADRVDAGLASIVDVLLERAVLRDGCAPRVPPRGVAQGSPLAPLLVNLLLAGVDRHMSERGFPCVRYSDDLVVATVTKDDAHDALSVLRAALWEIGMRLDDDKTSIMSFDDGFAFVGEDFGPRYPVTNPLFRVEPRDRKSLYVSRPGCRVSVQDGQARVTHDDDELLAVPTGHVERLVLFGPVGLSAGARSWAASNGVDVVMCSQRGNYLGQLLAGSPRRVSRKIAQYRLTEDSGRRAEIAREIVDAKLAHQQTLLRRFTRAESADTVIVALERCQQLRDMLPDAQTPAETMGLEGAAAAAYFGAWPSLLPPDTRFGGRSRRPPGDAVNAALSLAYTFLHGEAVGAVVAAGLDPELAFLHEPQDRQYALANDLMEEFRPLIVDQVVVRLFRQHSLTDAHGRPEQGGVYLTAAGREILVEAYEARMLRSASGAIPGFTSSYRRLLHVQAQRLAGVVEGRANSWCGLSWR